MTLWNFYFQLFDKAVAKEEVVVFLAHLMDRIASPLLIVWDGWPRTEAGSLANFSMAWTDGSLPSICRLTPRNSIPSNTCGVTGNIMNSRTFARKTSGNSVKARAAACVVCAGVLVSSRPSGSSPRWRSIELYYARFSN